MRRKKHIILEEVLVEDYAAGGKSLARPEGKVVFVEDAVPGDIVDIRLGKSRKDWAEGKVIQFRKYSSRRVDPFCVHFGVCGGCQWQMLPYTEQLKFKQRQVEDALRRIGKLELPEINPIAGADQTRHYRNKLEYTFGNRRFLLPQELNNPAIRADEPVAGFHARGLFDKVVDIETCHLQAEPTNRIRRALKDFALRQGYSFYDFHAHRGFMRNVQIRICRSGELMVNLVVGEEDQDKIRAILDHVMQEVPGITTLLYTVNRKHNDSLLGLEPVVYHGRGYVIESLDGFRFKIGPKSFFQTNTEQAEKLYRFTREFAELRGQETVYDLYCGTGSIGIFLSPKAKKLIGVELVEEAVADARENAAFNGASNASFFAGDVAELCRPEFFEREGSPDVIVTDPPRAGMHASLVKNILDLAAPLVVYVSCNPATQARDLAMLSERYAVMRIQPVDMFPHTHHIENIVQLRLK